MSSVPPKSNMSFILSTTKTAVGALAPHLYLTVLESLQLSRANATTGLTCKQMFRAELNYVESTVFFFRMMALPPPPIFPVHPLVLRTVPPKAFPFPSWPLTYSSLPAFLLAPLSLLLAPPNNLSVQLSHDHLQ